MPRARQAQGGRALLQADTLAPLRIAFDRLQGREARAASGQKGLGEGQSRQARLTLQWSFALHPDPFGPITFAPIKIRLRWRILILPVRSLIAPAVNCCGVAARDG